MSINNRMDKVFMKFSHNRILHSINNEEWGIAQKHRQIARG